MFHRSKQVVALVIASMIVAGCLVSGCGGAKKEETPQNSNVANQKGDSK